MPIHVPQNFYRQTITRAVSLVGATNIYVSALPIPSEGYLTISPASATLREIIFYTAKGTDGNGTYVTVTLANRGLGGTTAQTHAIGEPIRMNVDAETIQEISDAIDQVVAGGAQDASVNTKGIAKLSVAPATANNPIAVGTNDPRLVSRPAEIKFGGTGADGALAITSGTTTLDLGGVLKFVKNYTSISITGTGALAFTNPHANGTVIILKSQGDVTLTSSAAPMISGVGMGAAQKQNGQAGFGTPPLLGGDASTGVTQGAAGAAAAVTPNSTVFYRNLNFIVGAGGGQGGSAGAGAGGAGGAGGAAIILEVGGALNFTTASGISAAGVAGTAGTNGGSTGGSGGGGGGGGGSVIILYNSLTANSGTIVVSGGNAGGASTGLNNPGGDGGGGGGSVTAGAIGGNATAQGGAAGGAGGNGYSIVALNTEFI